MIGGYWFRNSGNPREQTFETFQYDGSIRNEIHDVVMADLSGDGQMEIVAVEQEDQTIPPRRAAPRWYLWEQRADEWVERVILDRGLGGHDALVGDIDGDGDLDLCAKIWKRWSGNANDGREHVDYLENLQRP